MSPVNSANTMAHFRFSVINPLLAADPHRSLKQQLDELASRVYTLPDGTMRQFRRSTIEDWHYAYKHHCLAGLTHPPRKDKGKQRALTESIIQGLEAIRSEYPDMKTSNVLRLLDERGLRPTGEPSDSTIYRYLRPVRRARREKESSKKVRLAFEAAYAGALYQTDIMYGPPVRVKSPAGRYLNRQSYLVAILDDYSRVICHGAFFISQELMVYLNVLEQAIRKRGIPDAIYCDNGKVFLSDQVKRIGAEIGMRVVHTGVRDAAAKGKVERFFLTVRDQFLDGVWRTQKKRDLSTLNSTFNRWCEQYNTTVHSSLEQTPLTKWLNSPRTPRRLADLPDMDLTFLLQATRCVKKYGTFRLQNHRYETLPVAAGKKITVRYHKYHLARVTVFLDDQCLGVAHLLDAQPNNHLPRTWHEHQDNADNESGAVTA